MKLISVDDRMVQVQCDCGEINFVDKKYCWNQGSGYKVTKSINCGSCNKIIRNIYEESVKNITYQDNTYVTCPNCGSSQISPNKRGFGLGKSIFGGILLGVFGLLGGFIGSNKVEITCLRCKYKW